MYKNDLRDGMWKYYFDDGLKIEQGKYKDGKKDGEWLIFFEKLENEVIHEVITYENGIRNGQYTRYYKK